MTRVVRLVALDLPPGPKLIGEIERNWAAGTAVLPLDQRMMQGARRRLAIDLGASHIVSPDGTDQIAGHESRKHAPLQADDALVIATSGSTGKPKGVVHTHASLRAHHRMVGDRLSLASSDTWWLCLPAAHIGGFGVIARALAYGSNLIAVDRVDDLTIATALSAGCTHTAVVPTHLARHDFSRWNVVLVGGSRTGLLPANAVATYGLTETCGGVVYDGVPLPGVDVRIVAGEIHLRTASLARAYRHEALVQKDGWFATGDLGTLEAGRLRVDGRRDDLIVTGGNKVWPAVVESRLREHPLVADCAVRGVPDAEWGAVVCAFVVPKLPSHAPTLEQVRGHVKETLASYCAPRRLTLVDLIPRTSTGKVMASELMKLVAP